MESVVEHRGPSPQPRRRGYLRAGVWSSILLGGSFWMVIDAELDGRIVVFSTLLWIFLRIGLLELVFRMDRSKSARLRAVARSLVREADPGECAGIQPDGAESGATLGGYAVAMGLLGIFLIPLFDPDLKGFASPQEMSLLVAGGWALALAGLSLLKDVLNRGIPVHFGSPSDTANLNMGSLWLAVALATMGVLLVVGFAGTRAGSPRWILGLPWLFVMQCREFARDAQAPA